MRLPRLDFPGARHHVMNRGARREDVFPDDDARRMFLDVLAVLPERFGMRVHAFALMPNHFHVLLESTLGDLSRAMRHLDGEYSRRFNVERHWDGPVFRGRFRNRLVGNDAYWKHLLLYIHQNPHRAGLGQTLPALWTSHPAYLGAAERPPWLTTADLQAEFGSMGEYQKAFEQLQAGRGAVPADFNPAKLWQPDSTGTAGVPDFKQPLWQVADALAAVSQVTGQPLAELLQSSPGRRGGNSAKWLAAWWMSRHCGIDHGRICDALWLKHDTLSRSIRRVEERRTVDTQLRKWTEKLLRLRGNGTANPIFHRLARPDTLPPGGV